MDINNEFSLTKKRAVDSSQINGSNGLISNRAIFLELTGCLLNNEGADHGAYLDRSLVK